MKHLRMPWLLRIVATLSLSFILIAATAQSFTPKYVSTSPNSGGYYEYLPAGYNNWQTYPLIIFLHGIGECGSGQPGELEKLTWQGIPRLISWGQFPTSFTVGGQTHSFIVISPQFRGWASASDINDVVNYAIKNYRVNTARIYVTGLSMGGGLTWDYASTYNSQVAAIVPSCGASWPNASGAQNIANGKIAVWATHNDDDPTVPSWYTKDWVTNISNYGGNAKKTIWPYGGHDSWTTTYNPNFRENGMNVYEWMLQYTKGSAAPSPSPCPTPT